MIMVYTVQLRCDLIFLGTDAVRQKTLPFHKKCFQVAYPLPKIDLIAIADFAAGMLCGCV